MLKKIFMIIILILTITVQLNFSEERPIAGNFPDRSFIIGTYVIDYASLDENIITLAKVTAENSGQTKIYYKSDLTLKKVWVDISSGENLRDITDESKNIVSDSWIDSIELTHWVKSDGTLIDFRKNLIISINDFHSLLNPKENEDLQKLSLDYETAKALYETNKNNSEAKNTIDALNAVFQELPENIISSFDDQLASLDSFINYIKDEKKDSYGTILAKKIKDSILDKREIAALEENLKALNNGAKIASKNNLVQINSNIWEAIGNIETKIEELNEGLVSEKNSILEKYMSDQEDILLNQILKDQYKAAIPTLEKIKSTDNIITGFEINPEKEMEILSIVYFQSQNQLTSKNGFDTSDDLNNALDDMKEISNLILQRSDDKSDDGSKQVEILDASKKTVESAIEILDKKISIAIKGETSKGISAESSNASTEDMEKQLEILNLFFNDITNKINSVSALNDPEVSANLEYLDSLSSKLDNLYDTYLGALENNNNDLADLILSDMDELVSEREDIYALYGQLYKDTLDNQSEDLQLKKEELAKYELLLSQGDKGLLDIYKDLFDELNNLFLNDNYENIDDVVNNYIISYQNLPDYLQGSEDFDSIINNLLKKAEKFYLLNQDQLGNQLLSLTSNLKEPMEISEDRIFYDDYVLITVKAIEKNGVIYIPIKEFYDYFGIDVIWRPDNSTIEVDGIINREIFTNKSKLIKKDSENFMLANPVFIENGISYCEISYFSSDIENFIPPNKIGLTLIIIPNL